MSKSKKLQLEADKVTIQSTLCKIKGYREGERKASNAGLRAVNRVKADELEALVNILERRCKKLFK